MLRGGWNGLVGVSENREEVEGGGEMRRRLRGGGLREGAREDDMGYQI